MFKIDATIKDGIDKLLCNIVKLRSNHTLMLKIEYWIGINFN